MIVYGSSLSPFVRKVVAFAAEKGIELELKPVAPGSQDPDFREASPFGKMPGFRDGDFAISDSSAIVAYLDAIRPEPNLIPTEPRACGARSTRRQVPRRWWPTGPSATWPSGARSRWNARPCGSSSACLS